MTNRKIGMSNDQLNLDCINKECYQTIFPQRTMIQCGICSVCKTTENMPQDSAPGTFCITMPNSLPYRIVHCESPQCVATAQAVFNDWLAEKKQFYITQETVDNLFPTNKVMIPRSNGSITEAEINWSLPLILNNTDQICLICDIDYGDRYKPVSIKSILANNANLKNGWKNSKQRFSVLYENHLKLICPNLIEKINQNIEAIECL